MIDGAGETLPVVRAADLDDASDVPRWLVEGLWARAGVGILGGAPKCCKSWLALDLALSVASQTPCLDAFAVHDPGPVMLYMAEDAASVVKTRLLGLCRHRSLALAALPIDVITASSVRIDRERDQARLARTVRRVGARPTCAATQDIYRYQRRCHQTRPRAASTRNRHTSTMASAKIRLLIFERPARLSTNTMGTSTTERPLRSAR